MEQDRAELKQWRALDEFFICGVRSLLDYDDVAAGATERLRALKSRDAVERAVQLLEWLTMEVLPLLQVPIPEVHSVDDARNAERNLKLLLEALRAQAVAVSTAVGYPHPREARYVARTAIDQAARAARHAWHAERRMTQLRPKEKRPFGDRPLDQCKRSAEMTGSAWAHMCCLVDEAHWSLRFLGATSRERELEARRARDALREVGISEFDDDLVELAVRLIPACDEVVSEDRPIAEAVAAAARLVPEDARVAVALVSGSAQLVEWEAPGATSASLADAARVILRDVLAEVAECLVARRTGY